MAAVLEFLLSSGVSMLVTTVPAGSLIRLSGVAFTLFSLLGVESPVSVNSSVRASVTSLLGLSSFAFLVGGSELLMKLAMASMDSKSSSFSRSESISSPLGSGFSAEAVMDVWGGSLGVTLAVVLVAFVTGCFLLGDSFSCPPRGGVEMLVGSRTGMILLLAVILTNLVADPAGEAACFTLTGVITSLGGGVAALGGLMVTFTSMGNCLLGSGCVTQNPARAVMQLLSDQARSATACRWDLSSCTSCVL